MAVSQSQRTAVSAAVVVAATGDGQSASPDEGEGREGREEGRLLTLVEAADWGAGRKWRMDDGDDEAGRRWMMARRAAQVDPSNAMGQVVEVDGIIRGARGTQKKKDGEREMAERVRPSRNAARDKTREQIHQHGSWCEGSGGRSVLLLL